MHKGDAGHRDSQRAGVGKVGQAHATGLMLLAEDHVLLRPILGAPRRDASLQRATDIRVQVRVPPPQLSHNADRADTGRCFQDRHGIGFPDGGQRVRPPPGTWRRLL